MHNREIITREWHYLLVWMLLGLVLLPCLISIFSHGSFHCVEDFYVVLAGVDTATWAERGVTWAVAIGPYVVFQCIRLAVWMSRHLTSRGRSSTVVS